MAVKINISWPVCDYPGGCTGVKLASGGACLAHAADPELRAALDQVNRAGVIDARGVKISDQLLEQILAAAPRGKNGKALFRGARFNRATFTGDANFDRATFTSGTVFSGATFSGGAVFSGATFSGGAVFSGATFSGHARFGGVSISGSANFEGATFSEGAVFAGTTFSGDARFSGATITGSVNFAEATFTTTTLFVEATFTGPAWFENVTFMGHARFDQATFNENAMFHKVTFSQQVEFDRATFTGNASFDEATFTGNVRFDRATFSGEARFDRATFRAGSSFERAAFAGDVRFEQATFTRYTRFDQVTFAKDARFDQVTFKGHTNFNRASFAGHARFDEVTFTGRTRFERATFARDARFYKTNFRGLAVFPEAKFEQARQFGPLLAYRGLVLDGVEFSQLVQIEISTIGICCRDARFPNGVQFRLRWARIVLDGADFPAPSILTGIPRLSSAELATREEQVIKAWQRLLANEICEQPQLISLMRANVAGLGLSNVTLTDCRFADAHNLDKMRLEADVTFAAAPSSKSVLVREGRQVLAEERDWRAAQPDQSVWRASLWPDWLGDRPRVLDAGQIADRYRALRKGREDAKNEPGAADFYYGEMEMRRHARTSPTVERTIVSLYWLVSGYGLRALRSLAALVVVGVVVTMALVGWGLAASAPVTTPPQQLAGTVSTAAHKPTRISAVLYGIAPVLPPASQRWTRDRTETALEVTLESFVFRSTDQPLTTAGTWTTIAARVLGPVLLALTLLAIRNRIKR
jgi:uncharacterized protein YjbI with pentapeptide repeats